MANRYWVGGSGNWTSTSSWSTTSGGASGASVPTSADDVFFDANSFSSDGAVVTTPSGGNIFSKGFYATAVDQTVTIKPASSETFLRAVTDVEVNNLVTLGGSGALIYPTVQPSVGGTYNFGLGTNVHWIGSIYIGGIAGITINQTSPVKTQSNASDISFDSNLIWNTNNYDIKTWGLFGEGTLNPGSSTITIHSFLDTQVITLGSNTATWVAPSGENNNFNFTGTANVYKVHNQNTTNQLTLQSGGTVTVNIIEFDAGSNTKFTSTRTYNFTTITLNGTSGNETLWRASTTSAYNINKTSGTVTADYLDAAYSNVSGGATWVEGTGFVDSGNNTGWVTISVININSLTSGTTISVVAVRETPYLTIPNITIGTSVETPSPKSIMVATIPNITSSSSIGGADVQYHKKVRNSYSAVIKPTSSHTLVGKNTSGYSNVIKVTTASNKPSKPTTEFN